MRNSAQPDGLEIHYTTEEFRSFLRRVKAGEFDDLTEPKGAEKSIIVAAKVRPTESVREESAPNNWLDLIGRTLYRATSSWRKCLMYVVLLVVFFGGLGMVAHALTGISPWVAAAGSLGGGTAAGRAAYARRHAGKPIKNGERQLAEREPKLGTTRDC